MTREVGMDIKEKRSSFVSLVLEKTTISALTQIKQAKRPVVKTIWLMLFCIGVTFAIFQSYALIMVYLKFSVQEKRTVALTVPLPIPALTVCSNSIVNWTSPEVDQLFNITKRLNASRVKYPSELDATESNHHFLDILSKLPNFSEQNRINFGIEPSKFMLGCAFCADNEYCHDIKEIVTNNIYYGNCITFEANHSTCGKSSEWNENGYYRAAFYVNDSPFTTFHEDRAIIMVIHAKDTTPIMKMENIIKIYPGEFLEINVAQKEFLKLPWPYTSECVQNDDPEMQWKNLAHSQEHPYLHTMEACQESCLQNLSLAYCKCIDPSQAIRGPLKEEVQLCFNGCNKIPEKEVAHMCGCKESCKHEEFKVKVHRNPNKFKEGTLMKQLEKSFSCAWKMTNTSQLNITNMVAFSVSTSTHFTEVYTEENSFSSADLIGSVGGLFGIWIGMSVMSLIELIATVGCSIWTKAKEKIRHLQKNDEEIDGDLHLTITDAQENTSA